VILVIVKPARRLVDRHRRSFAAYAAVGVAVIAFGRQLHRTVANRTGWFVVADDNAEIGNGEFDRAHRRREGAVVEKAATGAANQRIRHQAETVNQLVLQQRLEQFAASPDLQLITAFVLQGLQGRDDVAGYEASGVRRLAAPVWHLPR
jgi:hypothetical protein